MIERLISFRFDEKSERVGCLNAHGDLRNNAEWNTMHKVEQLSLGWCHKPLVCSQYGGIIVSAFVG